MSEHATYTVEMTIGVGWDDETLDAPSSTDATSGAPTYTAAPFVTSAGNVMQTFYDSDGDELAMAWLFDGDGFGAKLTSGNYTWSNSTIIWADDHPTADFVALAGTGNTSDALKIAAFTETGGFGAEVDSTLNGAAGDEVTGCAFHPDGDYLFHWGDVGACGLHDFDSVAGTLSNYTDLITRFGSTLDMAQWHPDGTHIAVWTSSTPYLQVAPFSAGSFSANITLPSFTGGAYKGAAWSPDGSRMAASWGSNTYIFDFDAGTDTLTLAITIANAGNNLNWIDDSHVISRVSAAASSTFRIWNLGATSVTETLTSSTTFTSLSLSANAWRFAVSNGWIIFPRTVTPWIAAVKVGDLFQDVTSDVVQRGGILFSCTRGRAAGQSQAAPEAGEAEFDLKDTALAYAAADLIGRHVRLTATYASTDYPLWYGVVEDAQQWAIGLEPRVTVRCYGRLAELLGTSIVTDLYEDQRIDECIGIVLDEAGWPDADRDLDTSTQFARWFWGSGEDAMSLLQRLVSADGFGATFFAAGDGDLTYKSADARFTDARSTTSRATFATSPSSDPAMFAPSFTPSRRAVVNDATVTAILRAEDPNVSVIWTGDDAYYIKSGSPLVIQARLDQPCTNIIAPVETTDYVIEYGNVTAVSIDRTSGQLITITISVDQDTRITGLQLRGNDVSAINTYRMKSTAAATASRARYGMRPWQPVHEPWPEMLYWHATDIANAYVEAYKDGKSVFRLGFAGNHSATAMTRALDFELGDRVTVNDTVIGKSADYWIERITHTIRAANWHTVELELEQVVSSNPNSNTATTGGTAASTLAPATSSGTGYGGPWGAAASSLQPLTSAASGSQA